ncbi:Asp23/Gls24 family envelope stress response protein [Streptomyces sp. NBC_00083]|uniref:Asp23/Gls24 family envelope stress response protein n=1 Tax=Streptomyces sp. NBC_00083 TaxID=2975647 RepID=UPI00225BC629|nr:Asp23/Gls24 family envelope stress response protein [Streptomyces sp. NBC_00083]MCX5384280.1 Asp23/Gls24 family envelope stress response protein [Streptomyces sp. NBC_00083]
MTEPMAQAVRTPGTDEFRTPADSTTLEPARSGPGGAPATRGRTTIAGGVVEKIAALAAREVPGVNAMGSGLARTLGAIRPGRASVTRGVKVEVGERQTAIDLEIVVEYGVSITEVAAEIRLHVIAAVERMTELEVVEVNIAVSDVHLPDRSEPELPESRLQ